MGYRTEIPANRKSTLGQDEGTEKRRSGHAASLYTDIPRAHRHPRDILVDSSDSEILMQEPNNNTLKSNHNYIIEEKLSRKQQENYQQTGMRLQKENYINKTRRKSGFPNIDVNQVKTSASRKNERGQSQNDLYPPDDLSVSLETEAHYNDSMVVRPGSQYSNRQSYQSFTSSGSRNQSSRGQWEVSGSHDFIKDLDGDTKVIVFRNTATDSPAILTYSELYNDRQNNKLTSPQNTGHTAFVKQQFSAGNRSYDVNASKSYNDVFNSHTDIQPSRMMSEQKRTRNLSDSHQFSPLPQEATFDKCSKKDSGISSFMEETHGSEMALKVLSVKNLKTFNESFSEKSAINVSMNQSDIERLADYENKEKVKKWLHSTSPGKGLVEDYDDTGSFDCHKIEKRSGYHGDDVRIRSAKQQTGHNRHGSGPSEKNDACCQTTIHSPKLMHSPRWSPRQEDVACQTVSDLPRHKHSPRLDVKLSAIPDTGMSAEKKRTIKKGARNLNTQINTKRSKDIGAMMRNAYGSPAKHRLLGESGLRTAPNTAVKRFAEDLEYETEVSDDYPVVHMPTPPKSRKINQATRRQVPTSPVQTNSGVYRGPVLNGGFGDTSGDRMMSTYSDVKSNAHSKELYQRYDHRSGESVANNSGSRCSYDRNRSNEDNIRRKSYGHYEGQNGNARSREYSHPGDTHSSTEYEDSPLRVHLDRAPNSEHLKDRKMDRRVGNRSITSQSEKQNRHHRPGGRRSSDTLETGQGNLYKHNLVQDYVQSFERNSEKVLDRKLTSQSCQSKPHNEHDGQHSVGPSRALTPESKMVYANEVPPRQVRRFTQEGARNQNEQTMGNSDSVRTGKSQAKDTRRRSNDYVHQQQNMGYENFTSSGLDSDTPVKYRQPHEIEKRRENRVLIHRDNLYKYSEQACDKQSQNCHYDDQHMQSPSFHRGSETPNQFADARFQLKQFLRRERDMQYGYVEPCEEDSGYQMTPESPRAMQEKVSTQRSCKESGGINPGVQSPHYQRDRPPVETDHTFSPSGSLAKLRLSTPTGKKQFANELMPHHVNLPSSDRIDESAGIVYCNIPEDPVSYKLSESYRDACRDSRRYGRHNSGESYRSGRHVENLSDKENDYLEKDRTGFISLDEICSVSGTVNVQRYSRGSSGNLDDMRNGNISVDSRDKKRDHTSYDEVDRISPRHLQDMVEGNHHRREIRSPRETNNNTYTLSGPTRLRVENSTEITTDSFTSGRSYKSISESRPNSQSANMADKCSSMSEREWMSPNTSGKQSERDRDMTNSPSISHSFREDISGSKPVSPSVYSMVSKGGYEASLDTVEYTEDERDGHDRNKLSRNRIRDKLVTAEHQSPDYNIAHIRKTDLVKKPKIKKSLFMSNRNVEPPVNFNEFAQGISNGGVSEPVSNKQTSPKKVASPGDSFKIPFSVNGSQKLMKKAVMRNLPPSKSLLQKVMHGDVMSSTLREASRRHLSEIRNRAGNIVHSTPLGSRAPSMLNDTISTIQAPEEIEHEEVILI